MKKIILSLMMVLGTTLGAQAQTFDFSCTTPDVNVNEGLPTTDTQMTTFGSIDDSNITAAQIARLVADGYTEVGDAGKERYTKTANGFQSSIQYGSFTYRVVHNGVATIYGPFSYRVNLNGHGTRFFNDAEDAVDYLLQ